jgi:DUF4097 and DUF4098 domain-containing protein YvlB
MVMSEFSNAVSNTLILISFASLAFVANAADNDLDREFQVSPGGKLVLASDAGAIDVQAWDNSSVRVSVRDSSGFTVDMNQAGDIVRVIAEANSGGLFSRMRSNIRFTVMVPAEFDVELDTGGGAILVSDLTGNVDADTSGGGIEIGNITGGKVVADTSGGRIQIGDVDGDVEADTSGGPIEIGNVSGWVVANTSGGSIRIGNVQGDMTADTSGGSIDVGQGGATVKLDTSGGTIRAAYALGPVYADTSGGNIYLEGSATSVEADTSGGNIVIERSIGEVDADTSGGSITIRNSVGPINADTAGGRIEVELVSLDGISAEPVDLETAGGDITLRLPSTFAATIRANLQVSRRGRGDYGIYTDFPLTIQNDEDGNIVGSGDINGGGARISLETTNSDIHIVSVNN